MRYPITVYTGPHLTLWDHMVHTAARRSLYLVTPTDREARVLNTMIAPGQALSMGQALETASTDTIRLWTPDVHRVVEDLLPLDAIPPALRDTPGIRQEIVRTLRWLRLHESPGKLWRYTAVLNWPTLWQWLDHILSGSIGDELRLYQYAQMTRKVPGFGEAIGIWGGFLPPPPARRWIAEWAETAPVTVWIPAGDLYEPYRRWWRGMGAVFMAVDGPDHQAPTFQVMVDNEQQLLDTPFRIWHHLRQPASFWPVDVAGTRQAPLERAFARYQGVSEPSPEAQEPHHWRLFLKVASGQADRPETWRWLRLVAPQEPLPLPTALRWQSVVEQHPRLGPWWRWALDWGQRLSLIHRWREVAALVEEAWHKMVPGTALPAPLEHLRDWQAFDAWGPPRHVIAHLMRLEWPEERAYRVPTADEAPVAPGVPVLVDGGWRQFPRPPVYWPLLGRTLPVGHDAWLWDQWRHLADALWMVSLPRARFPAGTSDIREVALTSLPERPPAPIRSEADAWYQAWEQKEHNAWTGKVSLPRLNELRPTVWSPSAIEQYGRCPRQFYFQRILGIPAATGDTGAEVPPDLWGRWAHRVLQWLRSPDQLAGLAGLVDRAIEEEPPPEHVLRLSLQEARTRLLVELPEAIRRRQSDRFFHPHSEREVDVEWTMTVGETRWHFRGRLDRLDRDGADWRIVDYKTGDVRDPKKIRPDNLQLALYVVGLTPSRTDGGVEGQIWGVSRRNQFRGGTLDSAHVSVLAPTIEGMLAQMAERMDCGQWYPIPQEAEPCRYCRFRPLCPGFIEDDARVKNASDPDFLALWQGSDDDRHATSG